jgi:hypothetical protein
MGASVHEIIRASLEQAKARLAQGTPPENSNPTLAAGSDDPIEKLAEAVEFIVENAGGIEAQGEGALSKIINKLAAEGKIDTRRPVACQSICPPAVRKEDKPRGVDAATAGTTTPLEEHGTKIKTNETQVPGAGAGRPKLGSVEELRERIRQKLAGEDVAKAHLPGKKAKPGELPKLEGTQPGPAPAGATVSKPPLSTNAAAIGMTPAAAFANSKKVLSQVFDEPSTNGVANHLQNAGKAGVKIAAVRSALRKHAERNQARAQVTSAGVAKVAEDKKPSEDIALRMLSDALRKASPSRA